MARHFPGCIAAGVSPKGWVLDHRLPLELGGRADAPNLQLQPAREARSKDTDENRLHALVCGGRMTLDQARAELARRWP
jgi:hypothetical protein